MRVAIIGDYPLDNSRIHGGVQAAFSYLVKGLCRIDGLQLHILTLGSLPKGRRERVEGNGAIVHLIPPFPRFEIARKYRTYQSRLNDLLTHIRPDLIHAQDASVDAYVALRSGYPTVITVHGVWRENSKHICSPYLRVRHRVHSYLIERYNLRHTRHLISISRYVAKYFSRQLRPETQVYFVPNAVDDSFFNLPDTSNGHTILFAGRVILRKRVLDLVQAFAKIANQVPRTHLRLAGEYSSEPSYVKSIRDFIRGANLEDRVHLLGALSEESVLSEFASCDLLVLPSAQETTPMVIAQVMAAGKPVIATPVGGVEEMVSDGKTGFLIDVGDTDRVAATLLRLLGDPGLRARLGESGRRFALEHYGVDTVARHTFEVYRSVANASN